MTDKESNRATGRDKGFSISTSWWLVLLTAVIVGFRAATSPYYMEEWSVWSWFLMTLPVTFPFVIFAGVVALRAVLGLALLVLSLFSKDRHPF